MLEFDAKISNDVLVEERQRVLRDGSSIMYDATAWNITMMHGLEALTIPQHVTEHIRIFEPSDEEPFIIKKSGSIDYVVDGNNDASVGFAARLMERGVTTRVIDKSTVLDGVTLSRGSIVVSRYDNEFFDGDLDQVVEQTATEVKVTAQAIRSGLGNRDLPDIGGAHFRVLTQPRIAILSGNGINSLDFGTIWHSIDSNLGIRHSHLDSNRLSYTDLRRYNTLVIPTTRYSQLSKGELSTIKTWVEAGGTLVAIDGSAVPFTSKDAGLSRVRQIQDTLKEVEQYDISLQREWLAQQNSYAEIENIWSHDAATDINYPWKSGAKPKSEKVERSN